MFLRTFFLSAASALALAGCAAGPDHISSTPTPDVETGPFLSAETDVVSQEAVYFPFTGTTRKEDNTKNTTVGLTCPLIPTYIVLDTSDSDVFMAECSEGLVLPLE